MRIVIALLLCIAPAAWGLCPFPDPQPCSMYFRSNAVFVGTVTSSHYVEAVNGEEDDDGTVYTLSVSRWFKGGKSKSISVFTPNSSSREPLEDGKQYLIFTFNAGRNELRHVIQCGDTFSGEALADAIRKTEIVIAANSKRVLAGITVIVRDKDGPTGDSLIVGVPVQISGPEGVLRGKTDKNGEFSVRVIPGTYQVKLPGRKFEGTWYMNGYFAERVKVTHGECAFVVLVTSR